MKKCQIYNSTYLKYLALSILLLAGVLRYGGFDFSIPFIDHPNEPHYTFTAAGFSNSVYQRKEMDGYPPGIIYVNWIVLKLLCSSDQNPTVAIPFVRFLAITFSLGTIFLMMQICFNARFYIAGFLAGLGWAITPLFVEYDRFAVAEPFQCFFIVLTFYFLIKYVYRSRESFYINAAYIAACFAILFKYPSAIILLPVVFTDIFIKKKSISLKDLFLDRALIARAAVLSLFLLWLGFVYGAYSTAPSPEWAWRRHTVFHGISFLTLKIFLINIQKMFLTPCNPLNLTAVAHSDWSNGVVSYVLPITLAIYFIPGFLYEIRSGNRKYMNILFSSFIVLFIAALSFFNPSYRHFIPLFPLFYILSAIGCVGTTRLIYSVLKKQKISIKISYCIAGAIPFVILILSITNLLLPSFKNLQIRMKPDIRNEIITWMDTNLPPGRYLSTLDLQSMFLKWSGYNGDHVKFHCFSLFRDSDPPVPLKYIKSNKIRYIIIPLSMYKEWNRKHYDVLKHLFLIRTFNAEGKFVPRAYAMLYCKI